MDLSGATYTCSDDDLCEVECDSFQDTTSCPEGLTCMQVGGPGPGGFGFRCKYSETAGQAGGEIYGACSGTEDLRR